MDELNSTTQQEAREVLRKFDKESDYRILKGFTAKLVLAIAISFSVFQLYTALFGVLDALKQRPIHVAFGLCLIFLLFPAKKSWSRESIHPFDFFLAIVGAAVCMYHIVFFDELIPRAGMANTTDTIIGIMGVILVLEATRRVVGVPILIIASVFILYAFIGPYIPGKLAHRGVSLRGFAGHLFFTTEGIFGIPIRVSSTFIFLFILFSVYLEKTGVGRFFIDLANAIAGWASGGPAKVAVLSSGLMGTVSGSSVANVVGTGSFTIPMMKSLGYKPEFAGAVEATASTGGQLMPPIMGAAAFLISEITEIPYRNIIISAAVPALLYFLGVWIGVHLEAKKLKLKGISRDKLPKIRSIMGDRGHLFLPLAAIVYLLVSGYTPMRAALWAILFCIFSAILTALLKAIRKEEQLTTQKVVTGIKMLVLGLEQGARAALGVLAATACAGIIIGIVTLTGLGLKMGSTLVDFAGGNLFLTLFFTMITSLILGMGVPTTANYIITSTVAAKAILLLNEMYGLGIPVIAAHLFVFYFGIIADVTPPVALAAFAGSGIAKSNPLRTGVSAFKLAIAAFIVPYVFVYNPELLMIDVTPVRIIQILITSILGIIAISAGVSGYLMTNQSWFERIMSLGAGILLVIPDIQTDLAGFAVLVVVFVISKIKVRKLNMSTP